MKTMERVDYVLNIYDWVFFVSCIGINQLSKMKTSHLLTNFFIYITLSLLVGCASDSLNNKIDEHENIDSFKHHLEDLRSQILESAIEDDIKLAMDAALGGAIENLAPGFDTLKAFQASMINFGILANEAGFAANNFVAQATIFAVPLWTMLCLGEYAACSRIPNVPIEWCIRALEACLEWCPEGFAVDDEDHEKDTDCEGACEQVKRDVVSPLVTVNPVNCEPAPLISAIQSAFFEHAKAKYGYEWKDDPKESCGNDCHCKDFGAPTGPSKERMRINVSVPVNGCTVTGSISVELQKYRRSGECFPKPC